MTLTDEERTWLDQNPEKLTLFFNPEFPPIEFSSSTGDFVGMGADIAAMVEQQLGVTFRRSACEDWNEHLASLESGACAIAPTIVRNAVRERYSFFTTPYYIAPVVIITSAAQKSNLNLDDLVGRRVGVVSGFVTEKYLRDHANGQFELVLMKNVPEGLRAVAFGQVDAFVENLAVSSYYIEKEGISRLRVAGSTDLTFAWSIGISRQYPLLYSSIQKALNAISEDELEAVRNQWISLKMSTGLDPETTRLLQLIGIFALLLLISLSAISYLLKRRLNEKVTILKTAQLELLDKTEHLAESEARFRSLFAMAPVPLVIATPEGNITDMNDRFIQVVGYRIEEMPDLDHWWVLAYPDPEYRNEVIGRWTAAVDSAMAGDLDVESEEYRVTCKDGATRTIVIGARVIGDNILVSFFDVTERECAEKELRNLRNYLSNIINSMPSVLVGVDPKGTITQWNREAQRATGISSEDAVGHTLDRAFPSLAPEMEKVREAMQDRQTMSSPKQARHEGGETRYEDVTIYPLVANGVEGAVIRVDDVTEQVRLEEMMIQSEKMLSVGGLAAGMAHEINNPLAGMMQTASVMGNRLANLKLPANQRAAEQAGTTVEAVGEFMEARNIPRMIATLTASGQRVAAIVENMLSFARKDDTRKSAHRLEELLDKTLDLAATDYDLRNDYDFKTIGIKKEYDTNLPPVPCERAKIQQVLLNILRNGAQAMQGSGTKEPMFTVRTRLDTKRQMVCMEIEDNGPGMDEDIRKRVFEPFFTTKLVGVGTGLGLSVSYFIITENHDGELAVKSRPGSGARFIIGLPLEGRNSDT